LKYNDLDIYARRGTIGMDPAFEGAREMSKERRIESGLSKRIPYVGTGG
jgi:hypothetical protein